MGQVDREWNNQSQNWQKADARVLGQILTAQNVVFALPDTARIAEFYAQALMSMPGISACRVCLGDNSAQAGVMTSGACAECETRRRFAGKDTPLIPISADFRCPLADQPDKRVIVVDSYQHHFGFFVIQLDDATIFEVYQPFVNNLANYVAIVLENRWQKELLQQAHAELESRVEERTRGLTAANEALDAARLAALNSMREAIEARQRAEQAHSDLQREVAERQRAEQDLILLSFAVDNVREAIFLVDEQARFQFVNEEACRILGYSRAELLALHMSDVDPDFPPERWLTHWQELETKRSLLFEGRHRAKDGRIFPVEINANYIEYEGRAYNLALARDITARKQAEQQLLASEQLFRALVENSPDFIARYDREYRRIYVNPAIQQLFGRPSEKVLGQTPFDQSPLYAPQVYVDHLRQAIETAAETTVEMPFRTATGEMHWGHMRFVPELGPDGQVASVLAIGHDIHNIKENEQRLRTLAENFPDLIARFDRDGRYAYVNPAVEKAFGLPAEVLIGKTLAELPRRGGSEEAEELLALIRRAFTEGTPNESEVHWLTELGKRIFEIRQAPEKDAAGNIVSVLCIARDITERRQAEEALRDSERRLTEAQRIAHVGYWERNFEAGHIILSAEACRIFGLSPQEVPLNLEEWHQRWLELIHPEDRSRASQAAADAVGGGPPYNVDYRIVRPDGEVRFIHSEASVRRDESGRPRYMLGMMQDITERRRAEEDLRESEERLRQITSSLREAIWLRDAQSRQILYVNPAFEELTGRTCKSLYENRDIVIEALHPDDKEWVIKALDRRSENVPFDIEHRIVHLDGSVRWVASRSFPVRNEAGEVYRWASIMEDITARRQTEETLMRERNLLRTLIDHIPDFIYIKDVESRFLIANVAVAQHMGAASPAELVGKTDWDFYPPERAAQFYTDERAILQSGEPLLNHDEPNADTAGNLRWIMTTKLPLRDSQGQIIGLVGIGHDLTERRQAEQERQAHLRFLASLDQINQALQSTNEFEQMMSDVLDVILSIFDCDRAFLMYPCNPEAAFWTSPMERTKPEYPGVLARGMALPMEPGMAEIVRLVLKSDGPVKFGPGADHPLPTNVTETFGIKSYMAMALYPRVGQPWQFGIHQCSDARVWTREEEQLLREIGRRLSYALTSLLTLRDLQESEAKFSTAFHSSPSALSVSTAKDHVYIDVNDSFLEWTGYTRAEVMGHTSVELQLWADLDQNREFRRRLHDQGRVHNFEYAFRRKDGEVRYALVSATFITLGGERCVLAQSNDITDRKQAEEALRHLNRELQAISDCNQTLLRAMDEQSLLNDICHIVCDKAGYRMAWVGYAESDESRTVRPVAWAGVEDGYLAQAHITWADTERGRGSTGTAIRSGESAVIQDFMTDPRAVPWRENALQRAYRSNIALPLKDESAKTFGALTIYSTEPNAFTPDETRLLEELAGDLAFGIIALRTRAERQRAEEALWESSQMLRLVLDNMPAFVFWKDRNSVYLGCNYLFAANAGLRSPQEIVGLTDLDLPWKDTEAASYRADDQLVMETGTPKINYEETQLTADGRVTNVRTSKVPLRNPAGDVIGVLGTFEDITERKLAETHILRLNRLYATLSQINQAIVHVRDRETLFREICRVAVEHGQFRFAMISQIDAATYRVEPVAYAGEEQGYLTAITITYRDEPLGHGPTGTAIREGRCLLCQDIATDPRMIPWRDQCLLRGFRSSAAVPFRQHGRVAGALTVFAGEPQSFDAEDEQLLDEIGQDISFALEMLEQEAQRRQAEAELSQLNAELEQRVLVRTAELASAHEHLRAILDTVGEGVVFTDRHGTIAYINPAMERLTGYQATEAIGRNPRIWRSNQTPMATYRQMWSTLTSGEIWQGELINRRKDGALYDAALTAAPLTDPAGQIVGFVGVQRDITRQKELDRLKDQFVSNVSHELRTPLANILLHIGLLEHGKPDKLPSYLQTLRRESERLRKLIEDLLDLSRLDRNVASIQLVPVDLNQLLEHLVADRAALAEQRGLTLTYEPASDLPLVVSDASKLIQVVSNLLTNALNYTPAGGTVKVGADVRHQEGKRMVAFTVRDSGPGISAQDMAHLFERFYRGASGRQASAPGTGLGLAISQEIMKRLGGRITVESEVGQGAAFTVWLPIA